MYSTTGFSCDSILDLCAMIHAEVMDGKRPWPPILGLHKSLIVALAYMRRNRVQAELAETYGVSQPTISRAIAGITPLLADLTWLTIMESWRARGCDVRLRGFWGSDLRTNPGS